MLCILQVATHDNFYFRPVRLVPNVIKFLVVLEITQVAGHANDTWDVRTFPLCIYMIHVSQKPISVSKNNYTSLVSNSESVNKLDSL
jgi:hypothetical protein